MKTTSLFTALVISALSFFAGMPLASAQFTKLFDFDNTVNGSQPFGSVILSDNDSVLYGMTNDGMLYSINTDGSGFADLGSVGTYLTGSLIRSGNVLYGMTLGGGLHGEGTIFKVNTDGSGYSVLHDFNSALQDSLNPPGDGGSSPNGTLTISGNTLYGATYGAPNTGGNIFSIQTNGTGYTDLYELSGADGEHPGYGALVVSANVLYGTTMYGGTSGSGVLFAINTNGSSYHKLIDFNTANGQMPYGAVIIAGNKLFGNTSGGGLYGYGTIYSINTDGTGYVKLHDFDDTHGRGPDGDLTLIGAMLYGTTGGGGIYNKGTIFSIDTGGTGFQSLFSFNTPDGTQPRAQLSNAGDMLYGTAVIGGSYDDGTIFSYKVQPTALPICMVTVDSASTHNTIIWEKPVTTEIDSFIVYREITANNYKQIGALPYAALSEFTDTAATEFFPFTGNPNAGTYRYKLQVRYVNGQYSLLSPYHNTIFITHSGGTFTWNHYAIEDDSIPLPSVNAYILYRDDNNTGIWHTVQGVSATQTTVTDPDYASYPNGNWRVETDWGITCTPTAKTYSASRSNSSRNIQLGIQESRQESIALYPNPANSTITIETPAAKGIYQVTDVSGKLLANGNITATKFNLDVSGYTKGIYFLSLYDGEKEMHRKFVKE